MSWNLGEDDWNGGSDEDSDEGDNYSESKFRNLKSHTIYAVDASSNMFKKLARTVHAPADRPGHAREEQTEDSSPFYMVMEGLRSGLSESIILSPNDLTGIILYNVRKNSNSMSFDHIYVTMNLSTPGASDLASVEALRDLALRDEGPKFQQHFGSADNMVDISNVLFVARDIFDSCTTAKQGRKKVIFYTCNDDPQSGNQAEMRRAAQKAGEMVDKQIELKLVAFNDHTREGHTFDYSKYYRNVLFPSVPIGELAAPVTSVHAMKMNNKRQKNPNRVLWRSKWNIAGKAELGVQCFKRLMQAKKPVGTKFTDEQKNVSSTTKNLDVNTGTVLTKHDTQHYAELGSEKIVVSDDMVKKTKQMLPSGIQLLGFKPIGRVKPHHTFQAADFLYPDESSIVGSTALFTTLLERCDKKGVSAICRFTSRSGKTRFVALVPQCEVRDPDSNEQILPPGFSFNYLPYKDDIRKLNHNSGIDQEDLETAQPTSAQINLAKRVVQNLSMDFKTSELPYNPSLRYFMMSLQAIAMDKDTVDFDPEEDDQTIPDEEAIEELAGESLRKLKLSVYAEDYDPRSAFVISKKRPAPKEVIDPDEDLGARIKRLHASGKLKSVNNTDLKTFLKLIGQSQSGKKDILLEKIEMYYDNL